MALIIKLYFDIPFLKYSPFSFYIIYIWVKLANALNLNPVNIKDGQMIKCVLLYAIFMLLYISI